MVSYYNQDDHWIRYQVDASGDEAKMRVANFSTGNEPPMDDYMTFTLDELPMYGIWEDMRIELLRAQGIIDARNMETARRARELADLEARA